MKPPEKVYKSIAVSGVETTDELGCVPAPLLHADALRTTYGDALRRKLDTCLCMRPQGEWGRPHMKIPLRCFFSSLPVLAAERSLASKVGTESEDAAAQAPFSKADQRCSIPSFRGAKLS